MYEKENYHHRCNPHRRCCPHHVERGCFLEEKLKTERGDERRDRNTGYQTTQQLRTHRGYSRAAVGYAKLQRVNIHLLRYEKRRCCSESQPIGQRACKSANGEL